MEIRPLGAAMGAEVLGADVGALSDAEFTQIRDAFHTNQVLVLRDQTLSPAAQLAFSRRFGVLEGGYNHEVLGWNVRAFLEGFQD